MRGGASHPLNWRPRDLMGGGTPLTPWDYNQSLIDVENGQLPMLEPLLSFKNVLVDVGEK